MTPEIIEEHALWVDSVEDLFPPGEAQKQLLARGASCFEKLSRRARRDRLDGIKCLREALDQALDKASEVICGGDVDARALAKEALADLAHVRWFLRQSEIAALG